MSPATDTAPGAAPAAAPAAGAGTNRPSGASQAVGDPLGTRLRRARPVVLALLLLTAVVLSTLWLRPQVSKVPLAIDNPTSTGAMALAELLRAQGVSVRSTSSWSDALTASQDGATLALVSPGSLSPDERKDLARAGGDVVVLSDLYQSLAGLTQATVTGASTSKDTVLEAGCQDPDALAAARLPGVRGSVTATDASGHQIPGATGCFPLGPSAGSSQHSYAYLTAPLPSGATLRVIADNQLVTNATLAQQGAAALAVRALGHHREVVWFDADHRDVTSLWDSPDLPRQLPVLVLLSLAVLAALAGVQGRRMGRLVPDPLPVVVRSTETTLGRGHLYRRAHDHAHAAEVLRAGTLARLRPRLGLPRHCETALVAQAAARVTGLPETYLDQLLAGPPPHDNQALTDLAAQLDHLESEVHS